MTIEPESVPELAGVARSGEQLIAMLVERARSEGTPLTGAGGLLQQLTKRVLESALEIEITDHLGYDKHDAAGRNSGNSRNGTPAKTVLTDVGPVEAKVPRDVEGSLEPQIVKKRQRRLAGVDETVLSLSAKGLAHGEISAHLAEIYGAEVSKQTISAITDQVIDGMAEWQNRPLDRVYPVLFVDAINVKIRDGKVANRPVYVVVAVTVEGTRDILGIWASDGGEGAKYWLQVFTELKNRARDQLSDLAYTLGRPHSSARHQQLCAEAADLYQLAGEISFDGNRYTQAAECYALAASASKEAGNADLWAAALTRHAFIGVYEKRFQQTSPLLQAAEELARNGDSQLSTRHWVAAVQAQVHAGLGDLNACNRALDTAQEVHRLDHPCPGGWLRFDGSRLDEERGSCYVRLGRLDLAETALTDALASKLTLRRQGSVLTDLAMIGARRHDVDRLLSYGTAAVELAERTSSGYIGKKLEGLRGYLAPFRADKRVSDFSERISSLTAV